MGNAMLIMQSILIIGGNLTSRQEKANQLSVVSCQLSVVDILTVEGNNSIGIEQIRELKQWISRKPHSSQNKAVLIPQAEKLTLEAQNSLLKTLEEPPKNTLIILTAPNEGFLLPTIVSRCKIIRLKPQSEIEIDKSTLSYTLDATRYTLHAKPGERIQKAQEIAKTREKTILFLDQLTFLLREILLAKAKSVKSSSLTQTQAIVSLCVNLSSKQIVEIIKSLLVTKKMIEKNVNFRLALENFFLDFPEMK